MVEEKSKLETLRNHPKQVICTVVLYFLSIVSGVSISSTSVILVEVLENGTMTEEQATWFASIFFVGLIASSFTTSGFCTWLGPKKTTSLTSLLFIIGLLTVALGHNFHILCIGRFILGIAFTAVRTSTQPLICEYSHPGLRGLLGSTYFTFICIGYASIIILGKILSWRYALMLSAILPAITLVCSIFMHESPTWLLSRGLEEQAANSLRFYDKPKEDIRKEIDEMKKFLEDKEEAKQKHTELGLNHRLQRFIHDFIQPSFLMPLIYLSVALSCIEWGGFAVLGFYLVIVFKRTNSSMDPYIAASMVGMLRIIWAFIGNALMLHFRRRTLFLISSPLLALSLSCLATYCLLTKGDSELAHTLATDYCFLPLLFITSCNFCFCMGYGNVSMLLVGEIFPSEMSNVGASAAILVQNMAGFLIIRLALPLISMVGLSGLFYMHAGVVLFMWGFAAVLMPETKGLTLREIQERYYAPKIQIDPEIVSLT